MENKTQNFELFHKYQISSVEEDGTINVDGDLNFDLYRDESIPIKLGTVTGSFINHDSKLKYLWNGPKRVEGSVEMTGSIIKSLSGGPEWIGEHLHLGGTKITSLKGIAKYIGGNVHFAGSNLKSLEGMPERLEGDLYTEATKIKSLKGSPKTIMGVFNASATPITSLEGGPEWVGDAYHVCHTKITSFKGIAKYIYGGLFCRNCKHLKNPEGLRDIVLDEGGPARMQRRRVFYSTDTTPIYHVVRLFPTFADFQRSLDYNYFLVKEDGDVEIIEWKLQEALNEISLSIETHSGIVNVEKFYKFI